MIEGSRAQVWNKTALRTSGGLTKEDLVKNKNGYIVSKKKSNFMKKNPNKNPLKDFLQQKNSGTFGALNPKTKTKTKKKTKTKTNKGLLNTFKNFFI